MTVLNAVAAQDKAAHKATQDKATKEVESKRACSTL